MSKDPAARYKRILARSALREAGCPLDRIERALRLVNLDEIEVDDDGEVSGLTEQVEETKRDLPEMFRRPDDQERSEKQPKRTRKARDNDGQGEEGNKPAAALSASTRQAAKLLAAAGDSEAAELLLSPPAPDPRSPSQRQADYLLAGEPDRYM